MLKKLKEGQGGWSAKSRDSGPRCGPRGWRGQTLQALEARCGSGVCSEDNGPQKAAPTRRSRGQRGWRRPGRALTIARAGDAVSRYRGLALEKGRRRQICDVLG